MYKVTLAIGLKVVRNDFYVDDSLTGGESYENLITIRNQITEILSSAGFNLIKLCSNHPKFINTIQSEKQLQSLQAYIGVRSMTH